MKWFLIFSFVVLAPIWLPVVIVVAGVRFGIEGGIALSDALDTEL